MDGYHGKIIFCWVITWDNALGEMEGAVLKAGPTLDCHLLKQGPSLWECCILGHYEHTHNIDTKVSPKPNKKQHLEDMKKVGKKIVEQSTKSIPKEKGEVPIKSIQLQVCHFKGTIFFCFVSRIMCQVLGLHIVYIVLSIALCKYFVKKLFSLTSRYWVQCFLFYDNKFFKNFYF